MNTEVLIKSLGLNIKEATVYMASLRLGPSTAGAVAKLAKLKRTTVYFVLDSLIEKGLASLRQTQKATLYSVVAPHILLDNVKRQEQNLEMALPELEKLYKEQLNKPKIETFEGVAGVRQVYAETEKYLSTPEGVIYFGSVVNFFEPEYHDLQNDWIHKLNNPRNKAREILDPYEIKKFNYVEEVQKTKNPNYSIRVMPRGISMPNSNSSVYGNKLAIFSLQKEVFVVVIESKDIADAYRNFFELAWRQAKPLNKDYSKETSRLRSRDRLIK
jgi:predicted transcriptional regulator